MSKLLWENFVKNVIIFGLLLITYSQIENFLLNSPLASDKAGLGSLLVAVSIIAVTACFGNFAFTYEKIDHLNFLSRLLGHTTTGILMLLIGLSLEMTSVLARMIVGNFLIFNISLSLLYIAAVLYDFWDLERAKL